MYDDTTTPLTTNTALSATTDPLRLAYAGFLARYTGHTLSTYICHLNGWLRWCVEVDIPALQVRRPHVEIWLRSLEERHQASSTRADKFNVVHLFYKYAELLNIATKRAKSSNR